MKKLNQKIQPFFNPMTHLPVILMICAGVFGVLAATGWIIEKPILASLRADYLPMAPSTAIIFIGLSVSWILQTVFHKAQTFRFILSLLQIAFLGIVLLLSINFYTGLGPDIENVIAPEPGFFGNVMLQRMSPLTFAGFILAITCLILLSPIQPSEKRLKIGALISLSLFTFSGICILGYLFGAPFFYGGTVIPIALSTALAFMCMGLTLLLRAGPTCWPLRLFLGDSVRARLMRSLVPSLIFLVILHGFISSTDIFHPINPAIVTAGAVLSISTIVFLNVYFVSRRIDADIERNNQSRLKAEHSLQESENRYRNLFEASPISLWEEDFSEVKKRIDDLKRSGIKDFETYFTQNPEVVTKFAALVKITDVNASTLKLFGAKDKESLLTNLSVCFPDDLFKYFREELILIASGQTTFDMEIVNRTLDRRLITLALNWAVVPGFEQDLSKIIVSMVDITERKQIELEKEKATATLRELSVAIEQSPVTTVITDKTGRIVYANPKFEETTGYRVVEAIGKNPKILKSGKTSPEEYQEMWQTILSGKSWHGVFQNKKKNGDLYWESAVISPVTDEHSNITQFIAVKEDITERLEADRLLRLSEEKLRAITDSANDAIIMIDPKGSVSYWNPAAERILGYKSSEAMGKNLHQLISPQKYHEDQEKAFRKFTKTGQGAAIGSTMELSALRKDGVEIPIQLSLSALKIKEEWHSVGIISDDTERKNAERKLKELADHDPLTGIFNRRAILEQLSKELARTRRINRGEEKSGLSLAFFDIDHFKQINDQYGHQAGDEVLKGIVAILTKEIRESDSLGRLGGDEFLILAPDIDLKNYENLFTRLNSTISNTQIQTEKGALNITISMGVSISTGQSSEEEILNMADSAMYEAKRHGGNQVVFTD